MLSQQDDSFKHISRLCKRHSHCCSAVYAAVNRGGALSGRRTAVVILWNSSKNYQSLPNKEPLAQFIWLLYFRPGLECFLLPPPTPPPLHPPQREDQVPLQITGKGADHEKDLSLMFHIISHTPSAWRTMRLETPSSDILVRNRSRGRIAG